MGKQGFTRQELRALFNLDPDRAEDQPTIAALQASSTRQLTEPPSPKPHHGLLDLLRRIVRGTGGLPPDLPQDRLPA
jgi:hypothetical protein